MKNGIRNQAKPWTRTLCYISLRRCCLGLETRVIIWLIFMAMKHFLTKFFKAANHYPSNQFILLTQGPIPDFFELAILDFFFSKKAMKISQSFLGSKDVSKFWWFSTVQNLHKNMQHISMTMQILKLQQVC